MPGGPRGGRGAAGREEAAKVPTRVTVEKVKGGKSKVVVETTDRPGLLVDVVRTLKDLSLNVVSAEIDTVGPKAYDVIYCTYRGEALNKSMHELVVNALMYYLTRRRSNPPRATDGATDREPPRVFRRLSSPRRR